MPDGCGRSKMAHLASILCGFLLADRLLRFGALNGPGSPELIDPPSESKHFLHKKQERQLLLLLLLAGLSFLLKPIY